MGTDTDMQDMLGLGESDILANFNVDNLPLDLDLNSMTDNEAQEYNPLSPKQADDFNDYNNIWNGEQMSGAGAGPLPASFGAQLTPNINSTVTEFTKRRNWSQRIIEELRDFLHILTPDGRILYASPSATGLTGHEPHQLVGRFISEFLHPDDGAMFVREFNESIASGHPLRFFYRFRRPDDTYAIFESFGHPHIASEAASYGSNSGANFCRGFFIMARPYPTRNAALLDSFLEHKIENERLKKRIADLKREEHEDAEGYAGSSLKLQDGVTSMATAINTSTNPMHHHTFGSYINSNPATNLDSTANNYNGMPPPAKPSVSNTALTRQNLNEALAASRPDSINDKMARYEGATHIETIEMLTGLRYRDGERSKGISTGAASPTLIHGDAGIAIVVDKDGRPANSSNRTPTTVFGDAGADKKKKLKLADEYVCTDCGTLDSPEWRKGPNGPKTLCNACGLRWAKKEKKRAGPSPGPEAQGQNGQVGGNAGVSSPTVQSFKPLISTSSGQRGQPFNSMPPANQMFNSPGSGST